ncbi:hypothetical protein GW796_06120 [archaeon]|nr:hypothetical protein [archaeon]
MWSAIIGDIIGSTFEVENHRSKYFEFFRKDARFTDDTVCTVAVASILLKLDEMPPKSEGSYYLNHDWISDELRIWCCTHLNRGFGSMFYQWIANGTNKPYGSYGNGALMRISPVALFAVKKNWEINKAVEIALDITNISHNHKDAQNAVACYTTMLFNLLKIKDKSVSVDKKKEYIKLALEMFGFSTPKTIQEYMISLNFDLTCETSLLVACAGILEAESYEDVFSLVVSAGGDTDTYCAIAGPLAESIWGLESEYLKYIKPYFREYDNQLLVVMNKLYEL